MELNQNPRDDTLMAETPVEDSIGDIVAVLKRLPAAEIERVKNTVLKLGEETSEKMECCPACGGKKIVRNGHKHGKQAYLCRGCGRSFVSTTSTVMFMSHQPASSWLTVISDTLEGISLVKTAVKLDISPKTVFFMRHKILLAIESLVEATAVPDEQALAEDVATEGAPQAVDTAGSTTEEADMPLQDQKRVAGDKDVFEADETYTPDSFKGVHNLSKLVDRGPRKRGGKAQKRGLSKEQVCICTVVGRKGTSYARTVNRAQPTKVQLQEALAEHLPPDSLVLTDGAKGYMDLCKRRHCSMKNVNKAPEAETSVFNLNGVNNFHSMIKDMLRNYRGVSTKYMNRYNALFGFIHRRRWITYDQLVQVLTSVNTTSYVNTYADVKNRALLAI